MSNINCMILTGPSKIERSWAASASAELKALGMRGFTPELSGRSCISDACEAWARAQVLRGGCAVAGAGAGAYIAALLAERYDVEKLCIVFMPCERAGIFLRSRALSSLYAVTGEVLLVGPDCRLAETFRSGLRNASSITRSFVEYPGAAAEMAAFLCRGELLKSLDK